MSQRQEQVLGLCIPYLDSIHDLHCLLSTSKPINSTIHSSLTPSSLLDILLRTLWIDRHTSEWILFSYIASGFPTLLQDESHRRLFKKTIPDFPQSLFNLAQSHPCHLSSCHPSFTLKHVGDTWRKRKEVLVGLTDLVDNCVGEQWYDVLDFWDGGRQDAATLFAEPRMSVLQMAIYGEMWGKQLSKVYDHHLRLQVAQSTNNGLGGTLFKGSGVDPSMDFLDQPGSYSANHHVPPELAGCEVSLRIEWVKYAMPDWQTTLPLFTSHKPSGITSSYPSSPVVSPLATPIDDPSSVVAPIHLTRGGGDRGQGEGTVHTPTPQFNPNGPIPTEEHIEEIQHQQLNITLETSNHIPSIHPLRQVREGGPFLGHMNNLRQEHVAVMLHLLQVSPLWARITKAIRHRVIRLAHEQEAPSPRALQYQPDSTKERYEEREVGNGVNAQNPEKGSVEEFGKTIKESDQNEPVYWKQILWEDALWTSGWDGLEIIADIWEYDQDNIKAGQRRERRDLSLEKEDRCGSGKNGKPLGSENRGREEIQRDGRIPDDHPALQRLMGIYRQLTLLEKEPQRVTLKSITRPQRKGVNGWVDVPCFLGDLRLVGWNDDIGAEWEVA